jgi:hypothetical protein
VKPFKKAPSPQLLIARPELDGWVTDSKLRSRPRSSTARTESGAMRSLVSEIVAMPGSRRQALLCTSRLASMSTDWMIPSRSDADARLSAPTKGWRVSSCIRTSRNFRTGSDATKRDTRRSDGSVVRTSRPCFMSRSAIPETVLWARFTFWLSCFRLRPSVPMTDDITRRCGPVN